jgi:hypothetical protein
MKPASSLILRTLLVLSLVAGVAGTQAQDKPKAVERFGLLGQGMTMAEPDIESVLMLTEEQVGKLKTARAETIEEIKTKALCDALRKTSLDKGVSEGDRTLAADKRKEVATKMRKDWNSRVGAILTPKQKQLAESLNTTATFITAKVNAGYAEKLNRAQGDAKKALQAERDEEARHAVRERISEILTDSQKAVLAKARER